MLKYAVSRTPELFFLTLSIFIFFIGLFGGDKTLDINVHDTYFVFTLYHFSILISTIFFIVSLVYYLLKKFKRKPLRFLSIIHVLLTLVSLGAIYYSIYFHTNNNLPRNYYKNTHPLLDGLTFVDISTTISFLVFPITIFLIFPLNIIIGSFRKEKAI
ncbi:hypothetical protein [uncultured Tenacibaculum sp.]|uniref:hypothetical protein n=1 Tax=uncultured Tenacibaculum sp. TaxID=174713 RepID=UPI00260F1A78|nr:hypothetical protein [uncultured Tenacibaculum sp.]